MSVETKSKAGLEDVVAGESAICYLDGARGVLAYQGYDIHDLANAERGASFEEVCYLLWHGRLPSAPELGDLQTQLAAARMLPEPMLRAMRSLPNVDGMDALRTLTSMLGHYDPEAAVMTPQANYRKAVRLTGQMGSLVATWGRTAAGGGPIDPDPALNHAANFLYMLTGQRPSALATRAFDVSLVLHADHELNASTFAARVAAATLTDIHSTIVAAIGTLKGPLHGGANADVMRMLLDIGQNAPIERAEEFVRGKLARKEKISGFGHRVYRTEDPRATHLRRFSKSLGEKAGHAAVVRHVRAHRSARQRREGPVPQRRFLLGVDVLRARHSHRPVHADLRRQPHLRLDGARARAVREQSPHPAAHGVHRTGVSAAVSRARSEIAVVPVWYDALPDVPFPRAYHHQPCCRPDRSVEQRVSTRPTRYPQP